MNQTAHISLQLSINVKEQHSEAKNKTDAPVFPSAPACQIYQSAPVSPERPAVSPARLPSFQASRRLSAAFPVPSCVPAVPSGVSQQHLVAAGEGGSKVTPNNPQAKKQQKPNFPKRKDTNKTKSMTYMPKKSAILTRMPQPQTPQNTQNAPQHNLPTEQPRLSTTPPPGITENHPARKRVTPHGITPNQTKKAQQPERTAGQARVKMKDAAKQRRKQTKTKKDGQSGRLSLSVKLQT